MWWRWDGMQWDRMEQAAAQQSPDPDLTQPDLSPDPAWTQLDPTLDPLLAPRWLTPDPSCATGTPCAQRLEDPVHHWPPPGPGPGHPSRLQLLHLLPNQPWGQTGTVSSCKCPMLPGACSGSSAPSTAPCPAAPRVHPHRSPWDGADALHSPWFPSFCSFWGE